MCQRCKEKMKLCGESCWKPQHIQDRAAWQKTGTLMLFKTACSFPIFCAPNTEGLASVPNFYRKERQKVVGKMTLCPVELTASIKTKFSPAPDCQHFSGMEVSGTVLITELVDRGTEKALVGQTPPLEMERQVYQTNNVVFSVWPQTKHEAG